MFHGERRRRGPSGDDAAFAGHIMGDAAFAGHIMGNDTTGAGRVLDQLFGLDAKGGLGAAEHFQARTAALPARHS